MLVDVISSLMSNKIIENRVQLNTIVMNRDSYGTDANDVICIILF